MTFKIKLGGPVKFPKGGKGRKYSRQRVELASETGNGLVKERKGRKRRKEIHLRVQRFKIELDR